MEAGGELGGSTTDTATDGGFLQNLLGHRGEAIDFSLSGKSCLKVPLFTKTSKDVYLLNPVIMTA